MTNLFKQFKELQVLLKAKKVTDKSIAIKHLFLGTQYINHSNTMRQA